MSVCGIDMSNIKANGEWMRKQLGSKQPKGGKEENTIDLWDSRSRAESIRG